MVYHEILVFQVLGKMFQILQKQYKTCTLKKECQVSFH